MQARMIKFQRYATKQFNKMSWWQQTLAVLFGLFSITAAILVTVFHTEILAAFLPVARQMRYEDLSGFGKYHQLMSTIVNGLLVG